MASMKSLAVGDSFDFDLSLTQADNQETWSTNRNSEIIYIKTIDKVVLSLTLYHVDIVGTVIYIYTYIYVVQQDTQCGLNE